MKKLFLITLSVLALASCSGLKDRLDRLEDRVAELEKQCDRINNDLKALQSLVDVLDQADFIKSVTPVTEGSSVIGYTMEFRKSPSITIYYGKDGENGKDGKDAPRIGIRKDGDVYYWTIGDEWLLDDEGKRIRVNAVDGVTPRLKLEDGSLWISYDNGATWSELGETAPMIMKDIREDDSYVYITLYSGTEIRLPKSSSVISFEDNTVKTICVKHWDTNKDGELSYDEAAAVKSLGTVFQGMGIMYFNELAYFTGLEEIAENAFYKSGLQEVVLPASLKSIGPRAFYATPLVSVSIPETVETIGKAAFYACRYLEHANIPASFTEIPAQLFAGCWSLQEMTLPEGTTKIGEQAFLECFEMADVALPSTLDTLGNSAFSKCRRFTEIILPESVRSVGHSAFYGCENASRIELPDHITILDHMLFHSCLALETFTVPSKVDTIGWYTFWDCPGLTKLIMKPAVPPTVRTDNSGASSLFTNCPEDFRIYVPDVETYKNDPYWSRYSELFLPME